MIPWLPAGELASTLFWILVIYTPAMLANATPIVVKHVPILKNWNTPLNAPLFGKNKTWRGLVCGTIVGGITGYALYIFLAERLNLFDGDMLRYIVFGMLLGFGALVGDFVESVIKRKLGKRPGEPFPFWDGVDFVIGALLFGAVLFFPGSFAEIIFLLLFVPVLSLLTNMIAYALGLKDVWY
jgi:CDP-2,3-bis-(O-geranylgeranyl)-sn-glycerol synthase